MKIGSPDAAPIMMGSAQVSAKLCSSHSAALFSPMVHSLALTSEHAFTRLMWFNIFHLADRKMFQNFKNI